MRSSLEPRVSMRGSFSQQSQMKKLGLVLSVEYELYIDNVESPPTTV